MVLRKTCTNGYVCKGSLCHLCVCVCLTFAMHSMLHGLFVGPATKWNSMSHHIESTLDLHDQATVPVRVWDLGYNKDSTTKPPPFKRTCLRLVDEYLTHGFVSEGPWSNMWCLVVCRDLGLKHVFVVELASCFTRNSLDCVRCQWCLTHSN